MRVTYYVLGDSTDSVPELSTRLAVDSAVVGGGVEVSPSIMELHRLEDVSPNSTASHSTPTQVWLGVF